MWEEEGSVCVCVGGEVCVCVWGGGSVCVCVCVCGECVDATIGLDLLLQ